MTDQWLLVKQEVGVMRKVSVEGRSYKRAQETFGGDG